MQLIHTEMSLIITQKGLPLRKQRVLRRGKGVRATLEDRIGRAPAMLRVVRCQSINPLSSEAHISRNRYVRRPQGKPSQNLLTTENYRLANSTVHLWVTECGRKEGQRLLALERIAARISQKNVSRELVI